VVSVLAAEKAIEFCCAIESKMGLALPEATSRRLRSVGVASNIPLYVDLHRDVVV
jgi:hypothetical protein